MRGSVNECIFVGNVGNVDSTTTPNGKLIFKASLATSYKSQGEDKTEWINLVFLGTNAEHAQKYVNKGGKLYVRTRCQTSNWIDKQTDKKMYKTEFIVSSFEVLSKLEAGNNQQSANNSQPDNNDDDFDDDLPF